MTAGAQILKTMGKKRNGVGGCEKSLKRYVYRNDEESYAKIKDERKTKKSKC